MAKQNRQLSPKQKKFADLYLSGMTQAGAAKEAGYSGSPGTLKNIGWETRNKPNVKAYINERMEAWSISAEEVIFRIGEIATGSIADYLNSDGTVNQPAIQEGGRLIKKLKIKESEYGVETEIELYPADEALAKLMKIYGLEKNKIDLGSGGGDLIFKVQYAD